MNNASVEAQAADDALVVEIARLAATFAREIVTADMAADLSQQIAMECLCRVRSGSLIVDRDSIAGLVRTMVRCRVRDRARQQRARKKPEQRYGSGVADDIHPWMSPDAMLEEIELNAFYKGVLDTLRPNARLAFLMVRELGLTYGEVAVHLGIARSAVHWHVVAVQRKFRSALIGIGLRTPQQARGTGSERTPAARNQRPRRISRDADSRTSQGSRAGQQEVA